MGFLSGLFLKKNPKPSPTRKGNKKTTATKLPDIEIPKGDQIIEVEGTTWCKINLSDNEDRVLSLTPLNTYQVQQGWPEQNCVNVNSRGARRTTGKNWVGYIPANKAARLRHIVDNHGTTFVHARITNAKTNPKVELMIEKVF